MKRKYPLLVGIAVLLAGWLIYVNRLGTPPQTPQVKQATVEKLAAVFQDALNGKPLSADSIRRIINGEEVVWDSVLIYEDRKRWHWGHGKTGAEAFLNACRAAAGSKPRRVQELLISFIGPRKVIPRHDTMVWNFTVLPGLDGIWLKHKNGRKIMHPLEGGAHHFSGGQLVPFLPVRFGLRYSRVAGALLRSPLLEKSKSGRGRRFRPVRAAALKKNTRLYRFRSSDWYLKVSGGSRWRSTPLYRGAELVQPDQIAQLLPGRIRLAGDWFLQHLDKHGKFSYRYYPYSGQVRTGNYSYPRHAGTTLILYRIYRHTGDKKYLESGDLALKWLLRHLRKGRPGSWIADLGVGGKLGTTALTALTLLARRDALLNISPAQQSNVQSYDAQLHSLLGFITNQQRPDGSLRHYYHPRVKRDSRVAQNFPGQALWALAKGALLDNRYLKPLERGLDYQCGEFWNFFLSEYYIFPFSWEMQAIADIQPKLDKPLYQRFLYDTARSMFDSQYLDDPPFPDYRGGFGTPEWFVPLAHAAGFQLEGLSGAWYYAKRSGDKQLARCWGRRLQVTTAFLFSQQVTEASSWFHRNPAASIGSFRGGPADNRQQIDYSQHCLAGILNLIEEGMWKK